MAGSTAIDLAAIRQFCVANSASTAGSIVHPIPDTIGRGASCTLIRYAAGDAITSFAYRSVIIDLRPVKLSNEDGGDDFIIIIGAGRLWLAPNVVEEPWIRCNRQGSNTMCVRFVFSD
ncbi:hypothetical protein [Aureimonas leprariae]|uniref:Uncharacterized protein n=1 Tax=Plantimonas leprariae TaxID=2615207 RepID=A0A7V7PRJ2_9HYPH|nr:hypothetical protein [Aureimonas leprariae]KAB0681330.1 hypothetical protein F6X38_05440 [Aureimonas leprariae]